MYFLQQGSSMETTSNTATNQRPGAPIPEPLGDNSHWEHHTSQIPEIYEFEGYVSNTWTLGEHKKTSELYDATLHWSLLQTLYISFSYHWCSQYCRLQMACVEAPKSRAAANSFLVSFAQTWGTPVTLGIQVDTVRNVLWNQLLLNIREAHPALQVFRHCWKPRWKSLSASERIPLSIKTLKLHSCYLLFSIFSFLMREYLLVYPRLASKCPSTCLSLPHAEITGMCHPTRIPRRHFFPLLFSLVLAIDHTSRGSFI